MRRWITTLVVFTVTASMASAARRPNVLFIAVDDLRPQINCYGKTFMHTPHLDRLAEQRLNTASRAGRDGRPVLLVAAVKSFDPVIARRVALAALKRAGVDGRRIGRKHVEALLDLAEPPGNREIHLPGNLTARRVRGEIRFGPRRTG